MYGICAVHLSVCVNSVQCQSQACHVDESLYPHTFNPTLSLVCHLLFVSYFYLLLHLTLNVLGGFSEKDFSSLKIN